LATLGSPRLYARRHHHVTAKVLKVCLQVAYGGAP